MGIDLIKGLMLQNLNLMTVHGCGRCRKEKSSLGGWTVPPDERTKREERFQRLPGYHYSKGGVGFLGWEVLEHM